MVAVRLRDHAVVTWEAGGPLDQKARAAIVMIAPGEQRRARWATDRGGVETVVTQATRGQLVEGGRRHRTAKGTDLAEAHVVQQDDDNVRRTRGWRWNPGPVHFGLKIGLADFAPKRQFRQRELRAIAVCLNVCFICCHGCSISSCEFFETDRQAYLDLPVLSVPTGAPGRCASRLPSL